MLKKILLVEDEKILAQMYQDKLTQAGFEVFLTSEAKDGLLLAQEKRPDLILLDILLPDENGIVFLTELRKNPKTAFLTVLAFSNYDDPRVKKQALDLGVKEYLLKTDYTPKEIVAKIKKYLYAKNSY